MEKELSKELKMKIEMKDGKLNLSLGYDGAGVDAGMYVAVEPDYFIDQLAAAVPGESALEAVVVSALKAAFKA